MIVGVVVTTCVDGVIVNVTGGVGVRETVEDILITDVVIVTGYKIN